MASTHRLHALLLPENLTQVRAVEEECRRLLFHDYVILSPAVKATVEDIHKKTKECLQFHARVEARMRPLSSKL